MPSGSSPSWFHGLNRNYTVAYFPGGESWPDPISSTLTDRFAVIDVNGRGSRSPDSTTLTDPYGKVSGVRGCNPIDASWPAAINTSWFRTPYDNVGFLDDGGRFMSLPLMGFLPRLVSDLGVSGVSSGPPSPTGNRMPEPFLRYWSDLCRVTPAGRYIKPGYLGMGPLNSHFLIPHWDGLDNDQDGVVDNMVPDARIGGDWDDAKYASTDNFEIYKAAGHSKGHFVGDRAAIGRVNANEIQHPAVVWYCSIGTTTDNWQYAANANYDYDYANVVIGKKPFKGYTHWFDTLNRAALVHIYTTLNRVPYHIAFWYENQFADIDSQYGHAGTTIQHIHHTSAPTNRNLYVGNSPVHTIYVTAQSLDVFEMPLAEIKVMATIERTWDGKLNMLDFKWMPADVRR